MQTFDEYLEEAISRMQSSRNKRLRKKRAHRPKNRKRSMAARKAARRIPKSARMKRARKAMKTKRRLNEQEFTEHMLQCKQAGMNSEDIIASMQNLLKESEMQTEVAEVQENVQFPKAHKLQLLLREGHELDVALKMLDEDNTQAPTGHGKVSKFVRSAIKGATGIDTSGDWGDITGKLIGRKKPMSPLKAGAIGGAIALGTAGTAYLASKGAKLAKKESDTLQNLELRQHRREPDIYPHPPQFQPQVHMFAPQHAGYAMPVQQPFHQQQYMRRFGESVEQQGQVVEQVQTAPNKTQEYLKDLVIQQLIESYQKNIKGSSNEMQTEKGQTNGK